MGLFRPYEQGKHEETEKTGAKQATVSAPEASTQAAEEADTGSRRQPQKKGTRTPTRAEAEAARMERLHPTLTPKEAKKAQREASRRERVRALDATERLPERTLVRDHVDSQMTITEYTIPLMLLIMAFSIAFSRNPAVQAGTSIAMMAIFLLWIVNITLRWNSFKKLARARGMDPKQRGLMMYMINRMMTLRSMRRPEPRIKRGESY